MSLPDPARYAMDAALAIGADYADLDKGGGYLFRISRAGKSVIAGAGGVCSFPVNSATAFTLSRDKAHTKAVLAGAGLPVIPGGLFFAHKRQARLRSPGREADDARAFARQLGFPVFAKPNQGSRGNFAEIIADDAGLAGYIARVAVEFESFLIEPVMRGAEHRVLVQDGQPVFHSRKEAPVLLGDGRRTIGELLDELNRSLSGQGVSAYPDATFDLLGRRAGEIPAASERIILPGRRNLSAAGDVEQVEPGAPSVLAMPAIRAVAAIGLRIGAVDMFDISAAGDLSDLKIIEVNGNPGLRTLELAGRSDLIRAIWTSMLNECLR